MYFADVNLGLTADVTTSGKPTTESTRVTAQQNDPQPSLADRSDPGGARGLTVLLVIGAVLFWSAVFAPDPMVSQAAFLGGLVVLVACVGLAGADMLRRLRDERQRAILSALVARDPGPSVLTDEDGAILLANRAAKATLGVDGAQTVAGCLRFLFANPSVILIRLTVRARRDGGASEDVVTRNGHLRLRVTHVQGQGFVWHIDTLPERAAAGRAGEIALPVITVSRSGAVIFMNDAARQMVGERVKGQSALFPLGLPENGELVTLELPAGARRAVATRRELSAGRTEICLTPLDPAALPSPEEIFANLPVALVMVDRDGEVLTANAVANTLLGQGDVTGRDLSDLLEGLGRSLPDWLHEVLEDREGTRSEFLRVRRDDREMFVQVTLNAGRRDGEKVLVAVLNDATELKTLEAQFVQSQKMQAIGQLAGGIAHDFNNLLTAISGHCDFLLLRHDAGDQNYADLIQIHQNANRAAALVGQLLAFSRKQTLQPEVLDMRDTLADLTHLLNRLVGERVSLTLSHDPVLGAIRADKRQLEQVMMNLVVNARDAMPDGGHIKIETEALHLTAPMERDRATVPAGDYVSVRVSDEGIGIAPDKLQKVFEPFYTTKRTGEGTGLGLSTAYGIVKQTGGFIFVDSGKAGTVFTLLFPVHRETVARKATPKATRPPRIAPRGEGVILLVEDEAPVRAFASRALRMRGFTVIEADSAEAALAQLEDPDLRIDLFVTDVIMPGLDGPSWVREARKRRPDVGVVFVSGYAEGALSERELDIPDAVFLPKPFSLNELTETVHGQLH